MRPGEKKRTTGFSFLAREEESCLETYLKSKKKEKTFIIMWRISNVEQEKKDQACYEDRKEGEGRGRL